MSPEEALKYFTEKKRAFQTAFGGAGGAAVLEDMARFCFAHDSTIVAPPGGAVDLNRTMAAQGRRECWLRIRTFLDRSPEELVSLFTKPLEGDKAHD